MALINTTTTGVLGSTFFGDGTGPLTIQQNGVTLGTYGNIPAFSAYQSSGQSVSGSTYTKVSFDIEEFDTNSNYNNTGSTVGSNPSYSFLPTIAGYYYITSTVNRTASSGEILVGIFKNGSEFKRGVDASSGWSSTVSALIYFNGTTDYVDSRIYFVTSLTTQAGSNYLTYFQGYLVKAA